MTIKQMNLIFLLKPHQSTNVTVLKIPSLNFLTICKFQIHAIPFTQLAKNVYKIINHHIALIKVLRIHWMNLLKCNITKAKENIILYLISFFNTLITPMHEHKKFTIKQHLQSYSTTFISSNSTMQYPKDTLE